MILVMKSLTFSALTTSLMPETVVFSASMAVTRASRFSTLFCRAESSYTCVHAMVTVARMAAADRNSFFMAK